MGSPSHAVVMKRGPSLRQGMTTPTWQASVKGALAQLPDGLFQEFRSRKATMSLIVGQGIIHSPKRQRPHVPQE